MQGGQRSRRHLAMAASVLALLATGLDARAESIPEPAARAMLRAVPAAPGAVPAARLLAQTPGSREFTVEATTMAVTNLAFTGTASVASGSVTLTVLRFTADSAVLSGLVQSDPCVTSAAVTQHWKAVHSTPASATTTLTGPVILLATSLSYTPVGGTTVTFDSTALPPVGVLVPTGALPQVQITATSLVAAQAVVQQLTTQVTTC